MTYNFLRIQPSIKSMHSSLSLCTNRGLHIPSAIWCFDVAAQYFEKSSGVN